ncbi:hypothetical protein E0Z10_g6292 [Xylaria hypoxylon]|uniref:DUF1275 domain protein n=1 Tax=Xylaria hypoxylon TaxID=37992 RepID=A0A4Z0YSW9_9PEZI|nr:hypothetical protein E0Z10_g6292 [Xylaria hypoxylon]
MSEKTSAIADYPVRGPEGDVELLNLNSPENKSITSRAWRHMVEDIPVELVDKRKDMARLYCHAFNFSSYVLPLVVDDMLMIQHFSCTGIQDAVSFPDYHCFASNQTGNTVFLFVALILPWLDGDNFYVPNVGAALGFFLLGGWVTGQAGRIVGPCMRLWLVCCNLIQTILVFVAAALQFRYGVMPQGPMAVIVVGLLAFASGSQVVQSRSMKMTEISTAMATAAWVDLIIDPKIFHVHNRPRTRRVMFLLALAGGSLLGAGIYRAAGSAVAVLISAAGKLVVTIMYLFNGADKPRKTDGDENC